MAADEEHEQRQHLRNEIMGKVQRGEPFTTIEEAAADELGVRIPMFLRASAAPPEELEPEPRAAHEADIAAVVEPAPQHEADAASGSETLADLTGEEWLAAFYNALAELWASAGWMPFTFGQLGAAVQGGVDEELVDRMFSQAAEDVVAIGNATRTLIEVAQQGLSNLQARRA